MSKFETQRSTFGQLQRGQDKGPCRREGNQPLLVKQLSPSHTCSSQRIRRRRASALDMQTKKPQISRMKDSLLQRGLHGSSMRSRVHNAGGRRFWRRHVASLPACRVWLQQSDCRHGAAPRSIWQMPPATRALGSTTAVPSLDRARGAASRAPTARSNPKEQPRWGA